MSKILELVNELKSTVEEMEATVELNEECKKHLCALYSEIWIEAVYDPSTKETGELASKLLPHIRALNDKLKFKK